MKIAGVEVKDRPEEVLILPRGEDNVVFRGRAVEDFAEFDALCPIPVPNKVLTKEGAKDDTDSADYKREMELYGQRKVAWIILKTLEPSQIEWDTIDPNKASTWTNFQTDLRAAKFTQVEINLITQFVLECNALDERKLQRARDEFFRGRAAVDK